ncbi:MAG: MBOAT family protein [Bacteroidia bacterium]|nr:MBOAT family protein [Bacteroidia bacterium]
MLFNSFNFLIFLSSVIIVFYLLPPKFRWVLLLGASFYFYMYFIPVYILILVFLILLDYFCGLWIEKVKRPKLLLSLSLLGNILILAFFKYWQFLNANISDLLRPFGISSHMPDLGIILPVGLSFHTFQSMSYTIDVYKGRTKAEKHLGYYALFVMFFPQLVAGPIERANGLLTQLKTRVSRLDYTRFIHGFSLICRGFFKKIVVADQLAIYVNSVFDNYFVNHGFTFVFATWLFAVQIYCDFSGYSDIAIGSAKLLGYDLMTNFNLPYFSKSVTEFWRRWHISLSSWLRDYLYISIGGSRKGKFRTYFNLLITMLIGGLWHGASWNFVIWGGLNGAFLAIEKAIGVKVVPIENKLLKALKVFLTFNLICFTWIFFRATNSDQSAFIIKNIPTDFFSLSIKDLGVFVNCIFSVAVLIGFEFFVFRKYSFDFLIEKGKLPALYLINFILIILILLFSVNSGSQFIYFQF